MSYFTDGNRTLDITLTGENGVDWETDFYDVGLMTDLSKAEGYEWSPSLYAVDDVDHLVDQAEDLIAGEGDFAEQGPDGSTLAVRELDPDDETEAAILSYVENHPTVVALAKTGVLGLDESLFRKALLDYEMDEDGDGYRLSIPALAGVDLVVRPIPYSGAARAYVAYPGGERRLGWMAYEDCSDSSDVDAWLDSKMREAADYVPEGLSLQDDLALLGYHHNDVEDKISYAYWESKKGDRLRVLSSPQGTPIAVEALYKDGRARWSLRSGGFDSTEELARTVWRRLISVED